MRIIRGFNWLPFVLISIAIIGCDNDDTDPYYKQEMRKFVQALSSSAKSVNPAFIIIPQNGQELVTLDGNEDGAPDIDYLKAIDGVGREDLFYGYDYDNVPTPGDEIIYMAAFLDICEQNNVEVLTTDYCWDKSLMDASYTKNSDRSYISFAANDRELNQIPTYPAQPYNMNSLDVNLLSEAKNFLYLINPEKYNSKPDFITNLRATNYDLLIIDAFFEDREYTPEEITLLKTKQDGGSRLVIAYLSIGEAEDYRYYWQSQWDENMPDWIEKENPDWEGNYVVKYWNEDWQALIFKNKNAYVKKILAAGFDGVYLDIIDAFEYFE